jgi:DNA polymerase-3 subunit delta'
MKPSAASSTILFDVIRGHSRQIAQLRAAAESGRLPHALLFAGPHGVGKRQIALALSQSIVCASADRRPCGTCAACVKMARGSHPDLLFVATDPELSTTGKILIEQVQDLCKQVSLKPGESTARPVIIEDADAMTGDAQNAFLKALEEPPGPTHFFLISADPDGLLPTIRSRCQVVNFGSLSFADTENILLTQDDFSPKEASDYARLSQGSVEEALQLKDGGYREVVDQAFALARLSRENRPLEWPVIGTKRDELLFLADALMRVYRDALVLLTTGQPARLFFADRAAELQTLTRGMSVDQAEDILEKIVEGRERLLSNISPRLVGARLLLDLGLKLF